jgi:cytochrome P450
LYDRLRAEDPVHWDRHLQAWVVTRHSDVVPVLSHFSAVRTPTAQRLTDLGLRRLAPLVDVLNRQMAFTDPPWHTRLRDSFGGALSARRVERYRAVITRLARSLLEGLGDRTDLDLIADFALPFTGIITANLLGVPANDYPRLKRWAGDFGDIVGTFQHDPGRTHSALAGLGEMATYLSGPRPQGRAGDRLLRTVYGNRDQVCPTEDETVANLVAVMVAGLETTSNMIANAFLAMLQHPEELRRLRGDPRYIRIAVEELIRFQSPIQFSTRVVPEDMRIGGKYLRKGQPVYAVIGAANRDPAFFSGPNRCEVMRPARGHVGFGWGIHFCLGSRLGRIQVQVALAALLERYSTIRLSAPSLTWRPNPALRGLAALPVEVEVSHRRWPVPRVIN